MKKSLKNILVAIVLTLTTLGGYARNRTYLFDLKSEQGHGGRSDWRMKRASELSLPAEEISACTYDASEWMGAVVPGTVLNSLVHNGVYPEPYFGMNNNLSSGLIPDLKEAGRDFYTYWFRTEFDGIPLSKDEKLWMQVDGINYRAEFWLNGRLVSFISGMFNQKFIDVSEYVVSSGKNVLAVKVYPVDEPGGPRNGKVKTWTNSQSPNGADGEIGKNVTMLMSVGWDFAYLDGIRDRNTGIWRDIKFFKTGKLMLNHPFVKTELSKPGYDVSAQTISVELCNSNVYREKVKVRGEILGEDIRFEKEVEVLTGMTETLEFSPEDYPQLIIRNPRLWWPVNKGRQDLYTLVLKVEQNGVVLDSISTRFGIREITSTVQTPDSSRTFIVNGRPIFIRGTNWLPEAMLRNSDERTCAELRYTAQSGVNLIRQWGGGITESDKFFDLCDELGIMVWTEFWMTGDTKHPVDEQLHLQNIESTIKRIRNHPCNAYYVCSNESTETAGIRELLAKLDGTRGFQMQSECEGVHDGSPYKTVNPMRHYENTASARGSRVDGFNPEYGAPCLPTLECLREIMPEKDLWPINKEVWDYSDGGGFHEMSTLYVDLVNQYGQPESIEDFAGKGQFVGAMNYKTIWEVWNYNKLGYGDRYCSGFLYWYHNSPIRQVCGRMWDWSLEPTAALYAAANACEPLHPQFDYLKNTVSVVNDLPEKFNGYTLTADLWDIRARKVWSRKEHFDIAEEAVVNDLFTIDFPEGLSSVHFISLKILDGAGEVVGSNFYWRSDDVYEGKETLTGPCTSGFEALAQLPEAEVYMNYSKRAEDGKQYVDITLKNNRKSIAFFTQIQFLDSEGKPVRPSFYTDNFFSMLPGEKRSISIETALSYIPETACSLVLKGFNMKTQKFKL